MTISRASAPIIRSGFPRSGSPVGTQKRNEFIKGLLSIAGDTRLLWVPIGTETTTSTDRSLNGRTLTYDATVAARYATVGSGLSVSFNGTTGEADTPDQANFTFGDGTLDEPFSVFAWVNQDATTGIKTILSKYDITTGTTRREWWFYLDASERLVFECYDESVPANIGRLAGTALATGSMLFVAATYNGLRVNSGVRLYSAAAVVDDTNSTAGTYVAMENTASLVRLGMTQGAAAQANFFSGSMAVVGLSLGALSASELWAMKALGNAFFDLAL